MATTDASDGEGQEVGPPRHSLPVLHAFLDQARSMADWHRQRAENFESKAGTVLGIAGVLLSLSALTVDPIGEVHGSWQVAVAGLTLAAAASFVVAAVFAVLALRLRQMRYSSVSQLRREWVRYRDIADRQEHQIVGMFADSLICGAGDAEQSSIESLASDADARGSNLRWSIWLLFVGFVAEMGVFAILSIEVIAR